MNEELEASKKRWLEHPPRYFTTQLNLSMVTSDWKKLWGLLHNIQKVLLL